MKRLLSIILVFVMCFGSESIFEHFAKAEKMFDENGLIYNYIDNDTAAIVVDCHDSSITSLTIPHTFNGKPVVGIKWYYYNRLHNLERLFIPNTVKRIYANSFVDCESLERVVFEDSSSLTELSYRAFCGCTKLKSIVLPKSLQIIGGECFSGCTSLESVAFEDESNLTEISDDAFYDCKQLNSIKLPESLLRIGKDCFSGCTNLDNLVLPNQLKHIGLGFITNTAITSLTFPKTIETANDCLQNDGGQPISVSFEKGTKIIPEEICQNSLVNNVIIPSTVRIIKSGAFWQAPLLKTVTIPDSVEIIADHAFDYDTEDGCLDTIYGYTGSTAEDYAKEHNIKFISIGYSNHSSHDKYYFGSYPIESKNAAPTPLKWRVLDSDSDYYTLILDEVIFSGRYGNSLDDANWKESEIRKFLNGEFFSKAFDDEMKADIVDTNNDYTAISNGNTYGDSTTDKVYILSRDDYLKPEYGFTSSHEETDSRVPYYNKKSIYLDISTEDDDPLKVLTQRDIYNGTTWIWTRDIAHTKINNVPAPYLVLTNGFVGYGNKEEAADYTWNLGIQPVIRVKKNSDYLIFAETEGEEPNSKWKWLWETDNFHFRNSSPPFYREKFVLDEDIKALRESVSLISFHNIAQHFAADASDPKIRKNLLRNQLAKDENLRHNVLNDWGGACYGMSLLAALFKAGYVSSEAYGGKNPNDLVFDDKLESYINVLHMTQHAFPQDFNFTYKPGSPMFKSTINKMFDLGLELSNNSSKEPYIIKMDNSMDGHGVVCFGAENGTWNQYHKRLLIADPNFYNTQYLYISDDSSNAFYAGDPSYDKFGYLEPLGSLYLFGPTHNHEIADSEIVSLIIDTDRSYLKLLCDSGEVNVFNNSINTLKGNLSLYKENTMNSSAENNSSFTSYLFKDTSEQYVLKPIDKDGNTLNNPSLISAEIETSNCSAGVYGVANSAELSMNGIVSLEDATGDITVSVIGEDNPVDYLLIDGKADGDVIVEADNKDYSISGDISDYSISRLNNEDEIETLVVSGAANSKVSLKNDHLTAMADMDNNGTYETQIDSVESDLNGIVQGLDGKWALYKEGIVDTSATGVFQNKFGWWRVEKGYVNFDAQGIYQNQYGWWKTTNGKVTFKENGVFQNENGWWRVKDSKVDFYAQGIYQNKNGWWKTTNGKVTFKENGVFQNENGWWKVKDSKVDFNFTGIASNKYGSWYVKTGKVDFNKNGKVKYNNKTYTIKNGKVV